MPIGHVRCIIVGMKPENTRAEDINKILFGLYTPFAEIERAINWPSNSERLENDAEHSFSLALVSGIMAAKLNLDANKATALAIVHDLIEIHAGDTSIWDNDGLETKAARELSSFQKLKKDYKKQYPWLIETIEEYEVLGSEEAKLVYALDKLIAVLMIIENDGYFWKENGITYQDYYKKAMQKREQVAEHPVILELYDEIMLVLKVHQNEYFAV